MVRRDDLFLGLEEPSTLARLAQSLVDGQPCVIQVEIGPADGEKFAATQARTKVPSDSEYTSLCFRPIR